MAKPFKEQGERIRRARIDKNLTQYDLAVALSVSVQSVSAWETGRASPEVTRLRRLSDLLGVDCGWVLSGDERSSPLRAKISASDLLACLTGYVRQYGNRQQARGDLLPPEQQEKDVELAMRLIQNLSDKPTGLRER